MGVLTVEGEDHAICTPPPPLSVFLFYFFKLIHVRMIYVYLHYYFTIPAQGLAMYRVLF